MQTMDVVLSSQEKKRLEEAGVDLTSVTEARGLFFYQEEDKAEEGSATNSTAVAKPEEEEEQEEEEQEEEEPEMPDLSNIMGT